MPSTNKRLYCAKCFKGLGYLTKKRIEWYRSEEKLLKNYLCRKCRKIVDFSEYLKKVREAD